MDRVFVQTRKPRRLWNLRHTKVKDVEVPEKFPRAKRMFKFVRSGTGTRQIWNMIEEANTDVKLIPPAVYMRDDDMTNIKEFCTGTRLYSLVLHRAPKLTFPVTLAACFLTAKKWDMKRLNEICRHCPYAGYIKCRGVTLCGLIRSLWLASVIAWGRSFASSGEFVQQSRETNIIFVFGTFIVRHISKWSN